jgi:hypothetical protein
VSSFPGYESPINKTKWKRNNHITTPRKERYEDNPEESLQKSREEKYAYQYHETGHGLAFYTLLFPHRPPHEPPPISSTSLIPHQPHKFPLLHLNAQFHTLNPKLSIHISSHIIRLFRMHSKFRWALKISEINEQHINSPDLLRRKYCTGDNKEETRKKPKVKARPKVSRGDGGFEE